MSIVWIHKLKFLQLTIINVVSFAPDLFLKSDGGKGVFIESVALH